MDFDQELKEILRRVDPPEGFGARLQARLDQERDRRFPASSKRRSVLPRWLAAGVMAATIGALAIGLGTYRNSRVAGERAQGIRARQELMLAVRIASQKANVARTAVQQTSIDVR